LPTELRICPHCGAAVSGDTKICPRCDGRLDEIVASEDAIKTVIGEAPDLTPTPDPVPQPIPVTPVEAAQNLATIIEIPADAGLKTVVNDEAAVSNFEQQMAQAGLEEPVIEFKTDPPLASIYSAQTLIGPDDELAIKPAQDEEDSEPVGVVDSTPHEFQTPPAPQFGMKTVVDEQPPANFSEARTEFFPEPANAPATSAYGSAFVTVSDTASHQAMNQVTASPYAPQYTPPFQQAMPIPRAPYTPPPIQPMAYAPPAPPPPRPAMQQPNWYAQPAGPSDYWLRQRTQVYLGGGYKIQAEAPGKIQLAYGKRLGLIWWAVGVMSIIGLFWYFLILLFSGFRKDKVTIFLEPDGYVFEDGSGAAHIRIRRWRSARRWGVIGIILAVVSLVLFLLLVVAGYVIGNQYEAELEQAYPEITFFESTASEASISQADIEMVRLIVLVLAILFALAALGTIGGGTLALISYIQAAAYHVDVPPLPGFW
jgi:hypothetical protein